MSIKQKIEVKGTEITLFTTGTDDFISLTDIARHKDSTHTDVIIQNWMRNRNTIELLGYWELIYNPNFKAIEFEGFRKESGLNSFVMTPKKWIENTKASGIISKSGRYGGTYAHKDIAFEFASWISVEFKLYIIKEFQRLKAEESDRLKLDWNLQRTLAKVNYQIHTDAIKKNLIPRELLKNETSLIYASEADILNMALFGQTASQWRKENPTDEGNIRDQATLEQLVVLTNLESLNAVLIQQRLSQSDRLIQLNKIAIQQLKTLLSNTTLKKLR